MYWYGGRNGRYGYGNGFDVDLSRYGYGCWFDNIDGRNVMLLYRICIWYRFSGYMIGVYIDCLCVCVVDWCSKEINFLRFVV